MPRRRECGCPSWVIRCAHLNDKVLQLADARLLVHRLVAGVLVVSLFPYRLPKPCPCHGELVYWDNPVAESYDIYRGDDLDAALAAFRDAETTLLRMDDGVFI